MTGLHCIQVVDHFKKWTILVLNRNVLGIWSVELLSDFLSAFCPRVGGGKMRLYGLLGGGNEYIHVQSMWQTRGVWGYALLEKLIYHCVIKAA